MKIKRLLKELDWEVLYLKNRVKLLHPLHGEMLVCYKYFGGGDYETELTAVHDALASGELGFISPIEPIEECQLSLEEEKERRKREMWLNSLTYEEQLVEETSDWKDHCQVATP